LKAKLEISSNFELNEKIEKKDKIHKGIQNKNKNKKNDDQIWKKKDNWSNDEIKNKLKFNKKTKNQNIEGQT